MKVLVCGDRHWTNRSYLYHILDGLHEISGFSVVIEGEAPGADSFARDWANDRGIRVDPYPAEWHKYRHAAGPIRNKKMLVEGRPELVVAFHKNLDESKGTKGMIAIAQKAHVPVMLCDGKSVQAL